MITDMEIGSEMNTGLHPIQHAASLYQRGYRVWMCWEEGNSPWYQVNRFGERLYVPRKSYRLLKAMEN